MRVLVLLMFVILVKTVTAYKCCLPKKFHANWENKITGGKKYFAINYERRLQLIRNNKSNKVKYVIQDFKHNKAYVQFDGYCHVHPINNNYLFYQCIPDAAKLIGRGKDPDHPDRHTLTYRYSAHGDTIDMTVVMDKKNKNRCYPTWFSVSTNSGTSINVDFDKVQSYENSRKHYIFDPPKGCKVQKNVLVG